MQTLKETEDGHSLYKHSAHCLVSVIDYSNAWRAWALFLFNQISDYSQAESGMACLVTLNILLWDSLTQNSDRM